MKLFRMFGRGIRDGFKSVGRNFSLAIASISCISITLMVVSLALMASFNVKSISKNVQNSATLVVFMNLNVSDEAMSKFEEFLSKEENVDTYLYKSIEERKKLLAEEDEYFEALVTALDDDDSIFHACFEVKVKDIKKLDSTVEYIKKNDDVQFVKYSKDVVEEIVSSFDVIEKIVFAVVIVLVVVTVFLIINTIKLTIFSRKREISIMRVVGASNWSIKHPFVIEGMIIGLLGSIIPILITIYGYTSLFDHYNGQFLSPIFKMVNPQPFVFYISAVLVLLGILVGMLGSSRAVRKYLKI